MKKICGIDLSGSEAVLVLVKKGNAGYLFLGKESQKIKLGNDESSDDIKSFFETFQGFVRQHDVELVVIKKRPQKGKMAAGAISFKMESLIQLNGVADVVFVTAQGMAAAEKKIPFDMDPDLKKYQHDAFKAAALYIRKHEL
jgi:hypothetical protein